MRDGEVELVLGSAGSNRIRSALLQTIVGVVDHGMTVREAVEAPRVHFEDGVVFAEPGIDLDAARRGRCGSCASAPSTCSSAASRRRCAGASRMTGAGDPRRGGVAVSA